MKTIERTSPRPVVGSGPGVLEFEQPLPKAAADRASMTKTRGVDVWGFTMGAVPSKKRAMEKDPDRPGMSASLRRTRRVAGRCCATRITRGIRGVLGAAIHKRW